MHVGSCLALVLVLACESRSEAPFYIAKPAEMTEPEPAPDATGGSGSSEDAAVGPSGSPGEPDAGAGDAGAGGEPGPRLPGGGIVAISPNDVYLMGARSPESSHPDAVALLELPSVSRAFPDDAALPVVRPGDDNRILYRGRDGDSFALFAHGGDGASRERVEAPGCDGGPGMFRVDPETGQVLHSCAECRGLLDANTWLFPITCTRGPWLDAEGQTVTTGELLAIGYEGSLLLGFEFEPDQLVIHDRVTDTDTPVELPEGVDAGGDLQAVRARSDGFWVAYADSDGALWRWLVGLDGSLVVEGEYSSLPQGVGRGVIFNPDTVMDATILDGEGDLLRLAWSRFDFERTIDVVVEHRLLPEESRIAYTEQDSPWIEGSGSDWTYGIPTGTLFSGP